LLFVAAAIVDALSERRQHLFLQNKATQNTATLIIAQNCKVISFMAVHLLCNNFGA
jgi:hypothetical protein